MIYIINSKPAPPLSAYHLQITRGALTNTLAETRRLTYALDVAALRIEELRAENENLIAENIRLTGQLHASLAILNQAVRQ